MHCGRVGPTPPVVLQLLKVTPLKGYSDGGVGSWLMMLPVESSMKMEPPLAPDTVRLQGALAASVEVPEL